MLKIEYGNGAGAIGIKELELYCDRRQFQSCSYLS